MIEKVGPIKNPLTIIAIFAAIAEISGSVVLPILDTDTQAVYVWFLMIFPTLLIILFFVTLWRWPTSLYAPSDYKSDESFLQSLPKATVEEKVQKITKEIVDEQNEPVLPQDEQPEAVRLVDGVPVQPDAGAITETTAPRSPVFRPPGAVSSDQERDVYSRVGIEELVFEKLGKYYRGPIARNVVLRDESRRYVADGIVREGGVTRVIEVRQFGRLTPSTSTLQKSITQVYGASRGLLMTEGPTTIEILLVLVIPHDASYTVQTLDLRLRDAVVSVPIPVETLIFTLGSDGSLRD
ncbi:MAG: hypothetical protein HYX47_02935 [Burkholderiales bacterium]|nr:hypothetical protein [Burkholderiales bacterium]